MNKLNLTNNSKTRAFGLLLAALVPTGAAFAEHDSYGSRDRGVEVGGTVVVSKQIPGGVITVGATIGQPRPVVVEERKVVVVERESCEPRQVTVIHREPVREVTVIREVPTRTVIVREAPVRKVVIIKKHGRHGHKVKKIVTYEGHGRGHGRHGGHGHDRDWDRDDNGSRHYYSDANQVSESYSGRDGNYHYYEDANQVSVQDNRGGQNRHVYVRK